MTFTPTLYWNGHLGFSFRRFSDQRLGWLVRFFGGSLGVTGGKFLSMISSATHPRWLPCSSSWIWFPLIFWLAVLKSAHVPLDCSRKSAEFGLEILWAKRMTAGQVRF
jgi:hypothetical protein